MAPRITCLKYAPCRKHPSASMTSHTVNIADALIDPETRRVTCFCSEDGAATKCFAVRRTSRTAKNPGRWVFASVFGPTLVDMYSYITLSSVYSGLVIAAGLVVLISVISLVSAENLLFSLTSSFTVNQSGTAIYLRT